mgnify:CR=1 FL=1
MIESDLNPKQELNLYIDNDTKVAIATMEYIYYYQTFNQSLMM